MTDDRAAAALRALREEFDRAFSAPPRPAPDEVGLLLARAGGELVALRVLETAGILGARRVVPVPGRRPELLGLAGVRGAAVPVFGAARLLGRPEVEPPRWIVLLGPEPRVGLAFAGFEGHVLVPRADLGEAGAAGHVAGTARVRGAPRPLLAVPSLLRAIRETPQGEVE